jgi:hypothetical protein
VKSLIQHTLKELYLLEGLIRLDTIGHDIDDEACEVKPASLECSILLGTISYWKV